jgi:hypothetical protein
MQSAECKVQNEESTSPAPALCTLHSAFCTSSTPAPADARLRPTWPIWKKILAYFLLTTLAAFSIWFVDRGAMALLYGSSQ